MMDAAFTTVIATKNYGIEISESEIGQRRSRGIQRLLKQLESELGEKEQAPSINLCEIATVVGGNRK